MKTIFTITAMQHRPGQFPMRNTHAMGWFHALPLAIDAVESNQGNMHESLYDYTVVEEIKEGVFQEAEARQWFKWDDKWVKCDTPEDARGTVNFAMG